MQPNDLPRKETARVLLGWHSDAKILFILTMVLEVSVSQLCAVPLSRSPVVVAGDNFLLFPHLPYIISPEPMLSSWPVTGFWLLFPLITPMAWATSAVPSWFLRSLPQCFIFSFVGFSAIWNERDLYSQPWPSRIPHFPAGQLNSYSSWRGDIWTSFAWINEKASNRRPKDQLGLLRSDI